MSKVILIIYLSAESETSALKLFTCNFERSILFSISEGIDVFCVSMTKLVHPLLIRFSRKVDFRLVYMAVHAARDITYNRFAASRLCLKDDKCCIISNAIFV